MRTGIWRLGLCVILLGLCLRTSADSQDANAQPPQRFTSRTDAVRVDVLVTNRGRTVTGLTAQDFEVRDEGVLQRVEVIDTETTPLNLIYLVDTSASSSGGGRLAYLVSAAGAALDGLQPRDRIALLSFSNRVRVLSPLTSDHASIRTALGTLVVEGARAALRDAVFTALASRHADPGRTVLLLFSNGWDLLSWMREGALLAAARRSDVVVYAVAVRIHGDSPKEYGKPLDDLATETGGRIVIADEGRDLRGVFVNIIAECRGRYVLTYAPIGVAATGWHRLDVKLKGKPGTITARRGYFAE